MTLESRVRIFEDVKHAIGLKPAIIYSVQFNQKYVQKHGSAVDAIYADFSNPHALQTYADRENAVYSRYMRMCKHTYLLLLTAARAKDDNIVPFVVMRR